MSPGLSLRVRGGRFHSTSLENFLENFHANLPGEIMQRILLQGSVAGPDWNR
jgi:hypothetical protein